LALIFNAAIAVGAKTIKFLCVFFFFLVVKSYFSFSAFPVINIFFFEFLKSVFILGPIFSAVVFGNIIYALQKIIEKLLIKGLADTKPGLIPPLIVVIFFCVLIGMFLVIFEFSKALQFLLH